MEKPIQGILIEGKIEKGDFKRFEYLITLRSPGTVWLASPGGDLIEAIKIGELARKLKLRVEAPRENQKYLEHNDSYW